MDQKHLFGRSRLYNLNRRGAVCVKRALPPKSQKGCPPPACPVLAPLETIKISPQKVNEVIPKIRTVLAGSSPNEPCNQVSHLWHLSLIHSKDVQLGTSLQGRAVGVQPPWERCVVLPSAVSYPIICHECTCFWPPRIKILCALELEHSLPNLLCGQEIPNAIVLCLLSVHAEGKLTGWSTKLPLQSPCVQEAMKTLYFFGGHTLLDGLDQKSKRNFKERPSLHQCSPLLRSHQSMHSVTSGLTLLCT